MGVLSTRTLQDQQPSEPQAHSAHQQPALCALVLHNNCQQEQEHREAPRPACSRSPESKPEHSSPTEAAHTEHPAEAGCSPASAVCDSPMIISPQPECLAAHAHLTPTAAQPDTAQLGQAASPGVAAGPSQHLGQGGSPHTPDCPAPQQASRPSGKSPAAELSMRP